MIKQEYIQCYNREKFHVLMVEALKRSGGKVIATGTCLETAEYSYHGGNQCSRIAYTNVYWAVVEYQEEGQAHS